MTRFLALFACLATLAPSAVHAWSCGNFGCPRWCEAPTYRVGRLSADLESEASGTTLSETLRAMNDWTLVSCTALDATYGGRIGTAVEHGDGVSEIEFIDSGWPMDANIVGATTWVFYDGCISESDIILNGENYDFVTQPGYLGEVNGYSAVLHEGGHFFGLGHSQYTSTAMYFRYGIGRLEIKYDDEQGLCFLYPGSDPPPDCASTGCPSGQMCTNGVCVDAPTPACTSDHDCPSIQLCNTATGKCVNRPTTGGDLGMPCTMDSECTSALCLPTATATICSQTCDASDPRSCPTGFYCSGQAIGDCAVGVCLAGVGGTGAFGTPCESATDCASLFCGNGACSIPCEIGLATDCPGSYVCHPSHSGSCGVCGVPTEIGGTCSTSDECRTKLCYDAETDGRGFCTDTCSDASPCPSGFRCVSVGSEAICSPDGVLHGGASCALCAPSGRSATPAFGLLFAACVTLVWARATKRR